jgi:hypothetical protein
MIANVLRKNGVFLKNQCCDSNFTKIAVFWTKNANFFAIFWRKYFENHTIVSEIYYNRDKSPFVTEPLKNFDIVIYIYEFV